MPLLTVAPSGAFVWEGSPAEAAEYQHTLAGWTRTTIAPPGVARYYTADYEQRPFFNPYAALPLSGHSDEKARARLAPYLRHYTASFALDAADVAPMPAGEVLHPFQRAGVAYALDRDHALIGDPMGLGKSIQAVALANAIEARRILVLCPANVLLQWRGFVKRWLVPLGGRENSVFVIAGANYGVHPSARVVICSYDRAKGPIGARLIEHEWDLLILDEAHYLRNHSAARTKAIVGAYGPARAKTPGLASRAHRIVGLTGTYLPNRPRETYTIARLLDHESIDFMSEEAFQTRYNPSATFLLPPRPGETTPRVRIEERTGRLPELNARLRCGFLVRREKEAAAPQLPAKSYSLVPVGSRATAEVVKAERLLDIDPDHLDNIPIDLQGHIAAVRRQMGIAMVPLVVEHMRMLLEAEEEPLVLFAYHREVIGQLTERLQTYNPVVVTGATSSRGRQNAADTFARNPRCRLFVGQLIAAGTGIDGLQTRARRAVFAEPSWVPGENEQCVDRLHRIGQAWPVQADFLVAEGSLNERIIGRTIEKLRVAHVVLDNRLVAP